MTSVSLEQLQGEHQEWVERNFPDRSEHQPLLGMIEELGELAHAHLKHEEGIRGYTTAKYMTEAADAIGDLLIYAAGYCNANFLSLQECLDVAWAQVKKRDWQADPQRGGE